MWEHTSKPLPLHTFHYLLLLLMCEILVHTFMIATLFPAWSCIGLESFQIPAVSYKICIFVLWDKGFPDFLESLQEEGGSLIVHDTLFFSPALGFLLA